MAYFCDIDDVVDILSAEGVTQSTDDARGLVGDIEQQNNAIERAHSKVDQYIHRYYLDTDNLGNRWLKWCTAIFACVQLLKRQGGQIPAGLESEYTEYKDFLEQVMDGRAQIPGATLIESGPGMVMSNVFHDHRFRDAKIRANPRISTGDTGSDVPRDYDFSMQFPEP